MSAADDFPRGRNIIAQVNGGTTPPVINIPASPGVLHVVTGITFTAYTARAGTPNSPLIIQVSTANLKGLGGAAYAYQDASGYADISWSWTGKMLVYMNTSVTVTTSGQNTSLFQQLEVDFYDT